MQQFSLGQIVVSSAGRDKGSKFIVICIIDSQYVYISDGDIRPMEDPKKKKGIHLVGTRYISQDIKRKVETNQEITNSELRKALKSMDGYREQEV